MDFASAVEQYQFCIVLVCFVLGIYKFPVPQFTTCSICRLFPPNVVFECRVLIELKYSIKLKYSMPGSIVPLAAFFSTWPKVSLLLPRLSPDRLVKNMAVPGLGVGAPEVVDVDIVLARSNITFLII